jgi:hypothetical protein
MGQVMSVEAMGRIILVISTRRRATCSAQSIDPLRKIPSPPFETISAPSVDKFQIKTTSFIAKDARLGDLLEFLLSHSPILAREGPANFTAGCRCKALNLSLVVLLYLLVA